MTITIINNTSAPMHEILFNLSRIMVGVELEGHDYSRWQSGRLDIELTGDEGSMTFEIKERIA